MTNLIKKIGVILICVALFIITPCLILLDNSIKNPSENYDYKYIQDHGNLQKAKITSIIIRDNITVNGSNPKVILYEYFTNNNLIKDQFQTLDVNKLIVGDSVYIFVNNKQSIIKDLAPYRVSLALLWILPGLMIFFGLVFFVISLTNRSL